MQNEFNQIQTSYRDNKSVCVTDWHKQINIQSIKHGVILQLQLYNNGLQHFQKLCKQTLKIYNKIVIECRSQQDTDTRLKLKRNKLRFNKGTTLSILTSIHIPVDL